MPEDSPPPVLEKGQRGAEMIHLRSIQFPKFQPQSIHDPLPHPRLLISDKNHHGENHKSHGKRNGPEQPLAAIGRPDIDSIHPEIAGDERQRKEDDGDDGEDQNGFVVRFRFEGNRLRGLFCEKKAIRMKMKNQKGGGG